MYFEKSLGLRDPRKVVEWGHVGRARDERRPGRKFLRGRSKQGRRTEVHAAIGSRSGLPDRKAGLLSLGIGSRPALLRSGSRVDRANGGECRDIPVRELGTR